MEQSIPWQLKRYGTWVYIRHEYKQKDQHAEQNSKLHCPWPEWPKWGDPVLLICESTCLYRSSRRFLFTCKAVAEGYIPPADSSALTDFTPRQVLLFGEQLVQQSPFALLVGVPCSREAFYKGLGQRTAVQAYCSDAPLPWAPATFEQCKEQRNSSAWAHSR